MKDYNGNELNVGDKVTYIGNGTYFLDGTIKKITDEWVFIHCDVWDGHPIHRRRSNNIIKQYSFKDKLIQSLEWLSGHFYDSYYQFRDNEGTWIDSDLLIEDFKKYIKEKI